jgi:hypothetical protein
MKMVVAGISETPVNVYQTTRNNKPEDRHLNYVGYILSAKPPVQKTVFAICVWVATRLFRNTVMVV